MTFMFFFMFCTIVIILVLYIATSIKLDYYANKDNSNKNNINNNLIKEIEMLDDYSTSNKYTEEVRNIMVPDNVNIKEPTAKSTQADDCKRYTVSMNNDPEKTVIGTKAEKVEVNYNEDSEDSEENDPIKFL